MGVKKGVKGEDKFFLEETFDDDGDLFEGLESMKEEE